MMKSRLIIEMPFPNIDKILGDEESKKFKSSVWIEGKRIIIDIEAEDIAGLQAAVNSYINKIKVVQNILKIKRI